MGLLGRPLGSFLRVGGIRAEQGKVGSRTLVIDRVNQSETSPPVQIWVENLDLPEGERCELSGYETGRWIGLPPGVERAEGLPPHQAAWQFQRYFVVTSVQAPPTLAERFRTHTGDRR